MAKFYAEQDSMADFKQIKDAPYYVKPNLSKDIVNEDSTPVKLRSNKIRFSKFLNKK